MALYTTIDPTYVGAREKQRRAAEDYERRQREIAATKAREAAKKAEKEKNSEAGKALAEDSAKALYGTAIQGVANATPTSTATTVKPLTDEQKKNIASLLYDAEQMAMNPNFVPPTNATPTPTTTPTPPEEEVKESGIEETPTVTPTVTPSTGGDTFDADAFTAQLQNTINSLLAPLIPTEEERAADLETKQKINQWLGQLTGSVGANDKQIYQMNEDLKSKYGISFDDVRRYTEDINSFVKSDPLSTDWGKSIMDTYNVYGGKAAGNATANAVASNSGNIDSYSAANANRQRQSYINAGNEAVRNMFDAKTQQLINTLQQYGVNMDSIFGNYNTTIGNQQAYNSALADDFTNGADLALTSQENKDNTRAGLAELALSKQIENEISNATGGDDPIDEPVSYADVLDVYQKLRSGGLIEGYDEPRTHAQAIAELLDAYPEAESYIKGIKESDFVLYSDTGNAAIKQTVKDFANANVPKSQMVAAVQNAYKELNLTVDQVLPIVIQAYREMENK